MTSKKVFIAPSVFVALIDRNHPKHSQAAAYFRYFAQESFSVFTGYMSILEAYKRLSSDISPSLAREFLRAIVLSSINLLYPTEGDLKAAVKTMAVSTASDVKLDEAQMAVLASRNNIPQIATFDYLHPLFGLSVFNLPV